MQNVGLQLCLKPTFTALTPPNVRAGWASRAGAHPHGGTTTPRCLNLKRWGRCHPWERAGCAASTFQLVRVARGGRSGRARCEKSAFR
eukprot:6199836-Prymnesium_polylepis.2